MCFCGHLVLIIKSGRILNMVSVGQMAGMQLHPIYMPVDLAAPSQVLWQRFGGLATRSRGVSGPIGKICYMISAMISAIIYPVVLSNMAVVCFAPIKIDDEREGDVPCVPWFSRWKASWIPWKHHHFYEDPGDIMGYITIYIYIAIYQGSKDQP